MCLSKSVLLHLLDGASATFNPNSIYDPIQKNIPHTIPNKTKNKKTNNKQILKLKVSPIKHRSNGKAVSRVIFWCVCGCH